MLCLCFWLKTLKIDLLERVYFCTWSFTTESSLGFWQPKLWPIKLWRSSLTLCQCISPLAEISPNPKKYFQSASGLQMQFWFCFHENGNQTNNNNLKKELFLLVNFFNKSIVIFSNLWGPILSSYFLKLFFLNFIPETNYLGGHTCPLEEK